MVEAISSEGKIVISSPGKLVFENAKISALGSVRIAAGPASSVETNVSDPKFNDLILSGTKIKLSGERFSAPVNSSITSLSNQQIKLDSGTGSDESIILKNTDIKSGIMTPIAFVDASYGARAGLKQSKLSNCIVLSHEFPCMKSQGSEFHFGSGEAVIQVHTNLRIHLHDIATLELKRGSIVQIVMSGSEAQVRNLGLRAIVVSLGGRATNLLAGQQLVVGRVPSAIASRRNCTLDFGSRTAHISEFSFLSLAERSETVRQLLHADLRNLKPIADKVYKTAAALFMVTGSHGSYIGPSSSTVFRQLTTRQVRD